MDDFARWLETQIDMIGAGSQALDLPGIQKLLQERLDALKKQARYLAVASAADFMLNRLIMQTESSREFSVDETGFTRERLVELLDRSPSLSELIESQWSAIFSEAMDEYKRYKSMLVAADVEIAFPASIEEVCRAEREHG